MARRDNVAVLFCDLVGSTALLSRLGERANDDLRRDLFAALRRPVEVMGGQEVKSQGDGLMVTFTRVADAIACGVQMQRSTAQLDARDPTMKVAIRVGVSAGEATHEDHDWFGTPVVEAARLCSAAQPSEILVTDAVLLGASEAVRAQLHDAGLRELKGLPAPRQCWRVEWRRDDAPHPTGSPALPASLDTSGERPLVGRGDELVQLSNAFASVNGGNPRTVFISGEAGMGMTRLAAEAASQAQSSGAVVLYGRCAGDDQGALAACAEALRWFVASCPPEQLARHVRGIRDALEPIVPSLAVRLSGHVDVIADDDPAPIVDDDADDRIVSAVIRLVVRITSEAPLILVLDDLHRAAPRLLELVVGLVSSPRPRRLLVVGCFRADGATTSQTLQAALAKLEGIEGLTHIRLNGLDPPSVGALLRISSPAAIEAAQLATGGNPARIIELERRLIDAEAIDVDAVNAAAALASPYKGLLAFGPDDRAMLFGRDDLIAALSRRITVERFLAVVGPSGSGKSSLVRAGFSLRSKEARRPAR